jgi:hypothetical protein
MGGKMVGKREQDGNINKETKQIKTNQKEILEMKCIIMEMKNISEEFKSRTNTQ